MRSALVSWVILLAAACGGDGSSPPTDPVDAAPPIDVVASIDAGVDAGSGPLRARAGSVSGGVKSSSANYKLVGTSSPGGGTASSSSYQVRRGVNGAIQP
jgi:hypothetical protein